MRIISRKRIRDARARSFQRDVHEPTSEELALEVGIPGERLRGLVAAQLAAYRAIAGNLKLAYSQFEELEDFSRFGTRLDEHTRKVIPARDDAISDVSSAMAAERAAHGGKDTVPKGHPHGLAWNRSWHNIQRMNAY